MAKRILGLLFLLFVSLQVFAYDFAVYRDGRSIYFTITSPSTVKVVGGPGTYYQSGAYVIPQNVTNNGVTYSVTSIGDSAFMSCSKMTSITIPNSVKSIGNLAFWGCRGITSVTIPDSVNNIGNEAFGSCSGLTSLIIPNSITSIGDWVFANCSSLASITIGNSVTSLGNEAFYNCTSLTNISFPNSVTSIGNFAFENCSALTEITFSNSLTSIGVSAFQNCSALTELTLPNSVRNIGANAFNGCSGLNNLLIPSSVTSIANNAFKGDSLESIVVNSGNLVYDSRNNCNAIIETATNTLIVGCKNTIIPDSVTNIGSAAFHSCRDLSSITIPNTVTSIGSLAFSGCRGLSSITIPNSVTNIENQAFYYCSGLTSVTIGNSTTSIGNYAFEGCSNLTNITSSSIIAPQLGADAFRNVPSSCDVHIPCGSLQSYSSTWTGFSNFIDDVFVFTVDALSNDAAMGSAAVTTQPTCTDPTAVLTATANQGYQFVQWSDGDTNNPRTVSVTQDTTIVAQFAATRNVCAFGVCGANLTWTLYNDGELRISGTGPMPNYSQYTLAPWLQDTSTCQITCVVIEPGVTSIGTYAFYECASITSIAIPNSVTSIGESAFWGCTSLTNITIPNSVTSIGKYTFWGCTGLINIAIPDSVTRIEDYVFARCSGLTSITLPNTITSIGGHAFERCSSLSSITIPNSVISIGNYAFSQCSNLTSINIPNSVTSIGDQVFNECFRLRTATIGNSVRSIGYYAFHQCTDLTSIILPNSVKSVGFGAFHSCSRLSSAILSDSITKINDGTFESCPSLTSIIIPNSVTSIGKSVFLGCRGLSQVAFGNSVTNIGDNAFNSCSGLRSITIPNSVTNIGNDVFRGCSGLDTIVVANSNTVYDSRNNCNAIIETSSNYLILGCKNTIIPNTVTSIGNYAFQGCSGWKSLTLPSSITSIGTYAFQGCFSLNNITSLATIAPQITTNSFSSKTATVHIPCGSLQSYSSTWTGFSNFVEDVFAYSLEVLSNDTAMGSAAVTTQPTCTDPTAVLTATANQGYQFVQWSDGDTSNPRTVSVTQDTTFVAQFAATTNICASGVCGDSLTWTLYNDGELRISGTGQMYDYSSSQTSPWLQSASTCTITNVVIEQGVTSIGNNAFYNCQNLISISIPNTVTSIGQWAFHYCFGLTNINIPNSVTSIGSCAFYYCSGLTNITIPNSVTSIGNGAFTYCSSLTNITLSESITSIEGGTFGACTALTDITIPNSVTNIGTSAFSGCTGLTSVTSLATTAPQLGSDAFLSVNSTIPVHIPCGSLQSYTSTWSYFSNFVEDFAYSITTSSNDTTMGSAAVTIQPTCTNPTAVLTATANQGYQFVQWSDGDTSNPRIVSVTQDTTIVAQFAATTNICASGVCGDSLTWTLYNDGELRISGTGPMFNNYAANRLAPWLQATSACSITNVVIDSGVTSIAAFAFWECSTLTSISIPNSVTSIGKWTFKGCSNLVNIIIPNSVTNLGDYVFYDCSSLANIAIPNSVVSIGEYSFYKCTSLTNVTIGNSVTSIGIFAFYDCSALASIIIPNSVTSVGDNSFKNCSGLTSIAIPNSVTSIGEAAFWGCAGLTSITIPNSVTNIGEAAFLSCSGLTSITIPNSITNIANSVFGYCSGLTNITIPNSVTNIGDGAFGECSSLTNITIPNSVINIGEDAFYKCTGLTSITSLATTAPLVGANSFHLVNGNIPVHIPCGSLQSYSSTWTGFSNFVEDFAYSITASSNDTAMGSAAVTTQPTCTNPIAVLTATANQGYQFVQWSDGSTQNPRTITLTSDTAIVANFIAVVNDTTFITASICQGDTYTWHGQVLSNPGVYQTLLGQTRYGADSIEILTLTVTPLPTKAESATICQNNLPYIWRGVSLNAAGTYAMTIPSVPCDSVITFTLTLSQNDTTRTSASICQGDSYVWHGQALTNSGIYQISLGQTQYGCDSIEILTLTVNPHPTKAESAIVCKGDLPYAWRGQMLTSGGTYVVQAPSSITCDTIVTLNLTIVTNDTVFANASICQGDTYSWRGQQLSMPGTYSYVLGSTRFGCDSIEVLNLSVNPLPSKTENIVVCENDLPYVWRGLVLNNAGTYSTTIASVPCDSVITLNLSIAKRDTTRRAASICFGDTYIWHGQNLTTSGVYQTLLGTTKYGCDSIEILTLTVNPRPTKNEQAFVCKDDLPYVWRGSTIQTAGTYSTLAPSSISCDTVVTLNLTIVSPDTIFTTAAICQGDVYSWHGQSLTTAGTYTYLLGATRYGCDSIERLNLIVNPHPYKTETAVVCKGDMPYSWRGMTIQTAGTYTTTAQALVGCDTIVSLTLSVASPDTTFTNTSICQGDVYAWHGQSLTTAGVYTYQLGTTRYGCDSIEMLTLTVNPHPQKQEILTICKESLPFVWRGMTLTAAGTYTTTSPAIPCDSVITLTLNLSKNDTTRTFASICQGETYVWRGQALVNSGVYQALLGPTRYGCDSIEILTLTVNPLPTKTESAVVCKGNLPYAWRGLSLTTSGTYTALAPTVNSCDTVVTLNFVVASPDTTFNAASICQGDIYSWHGQSLVSSGVYSYQLGTTQHGCDSIEILYLTVNPHPTKLETAVVCANDMPYAWRGMNIVAPGSYTMMVPSINSCDTIVTLVLSLAYNDTTYSSASICQGDTYSWQGQSLTTAGVYSVVVGSTNQGCDSVEILTLTVNPLPTKTESAVVCKGDLPYVWRGQTLTTSGVFVALAPSVNTCDTIVTLNLTVASPDTTFNVASICQGEAYIWHGQTLVASGVYTYQLGTTQYGCDSVEVLNLTVNPYPTKVETAVVCANDMPYSWRGMNIVAPGSYTMVAPSLNSCDTIVTLVLSLAYNDTTYTSASICQGDIYTWRGQTLTNAGVYSEIIGTTSMGCDSIEILTLTVNQLPTLTESAVVCQGDLPYQWRGQSLIAAGVYTANAVSISSCDTIVTLNLTVVTNDTVYTSASLCQGDSLLWHGQTLSNAGVYFETVGTTIHGCDSVEQLTVTKYSSYSVTETIEITTAELPYQWNGMSLTTAGAYVYNGQSSVGCDSIVTLILTVSTDLDFAEENLFTVSPNPVEKGGTIVIELSANTTRFEDAEINLYSPNGKLLNRFEITENVSYIKMPEVAGLYILQLVTKTGFVKYEKVVVK